MDGPILDYSIHFTVHQTPDQKNISLSYTCFRKLERVRHPNFRTDLRRFSQFCEIMRLARDTDFKFSKMPMFLCSRVSLLNKPPNVPYSRDDLLLALEWMALSKALYFVLREYIPLPSKSTLSRITTLSSQTSDIAHFKSIFCSFGVKCCGCIFIVDEVYVKAHISVSGGVVYGWAVDVENGQKIPAKTVLCVMVKCLFTYETFLAKVIPCQALTADFQEKQVLEIVDTIEKCDCQVIAIILDNNKVNQKFFKSLQMFEITAEGEESEEEESRKKREKPWIVKNPSTDRPLYLIYDPVHLIKNIRNSWITEKTKKLQFYDDLSVDPKVADWSDLGELFSHEQKTLTRMSKLTKSTLSPNSQEKQNVQLALNVFDLKTAAALEESQHSNESWKNTAIFIRLVCQLFKVFNTKSRKASVFSRDAERTPMSLTNTTQKDILELWHDRAEMMTSEKQPRVHTLTKDTGDALAFTCNALQDVATYLLEHEDSNIKHKDVFLGFFQQDDIEHHFAHFRRASGCNYYISTQNVLQTHAIDRAIWFLRSTPQCERQTSKHKCPSCSIPFTPEEFQIMKNIHVYIEAVTLDEKMVLYHIGGSIAKKNSALCGDKSDVIVSDSDDCLDSLYVDNISAFTACLDRGGLKYITKDFFRYMLYSYAFFGQLFDTTCRSRIMYILFFMKDICQISIPVTEKDNRRVVNTLFKMYARKQSEDIVTDKQKGQQRKIAKLTSTSQKKTASDDNEKEKKQKGKKRKNAESTSNSLTKITSDDNPKKKKPKSRKRKNEELSSAPQKETTAIDIALL